MIRFLLISLLLGISLSSCALKTTQGLRQVSFADSEVEKGGKIEVVQSKGPEAKPVKYVVKTVTIKYEPEADEDDDDKTPQVIRIYLEDRKNSMADLFEEFSITEDTVKQVTIELEEGQRGGFRIMRGSTLIEDEKINYDDAE